jgi:hypothetical protein
MDPFVTTFIASRLAVELRARGRRVLLFDGVGQPWFLRHLLAIEGEPERTHETPDPVQLRQRGLAWWSPEGGVAEPAVGNAGVRERLLAAEVEAEFIVVLLPGQSLASYLECFSVARQEFLVVTETAQDEVGRAFARLREIRERLPGASVGVVVSGADRAAAETCFDRVASAAARLLRVSLRSYGHLSLTGRAVREIAAGRPLARKEEATARAQMAAVADLLVADGRSRAHGTSDGWFFDPVRVDRLVIAGGTAR